jgi:DNA-binding MurR/RpiR family transcriptional regulator
MPDLVFRNLCLPSNPMQTTELDMPPLAARIAEIYDGLSRQERLLADTVLTCARDLAGYTATELALRANVSKATATRLFRRLGYTDFEQARLESRRRPFPGSPLESFYQEQADPPGGNIVEAHVNSEMRNLAETFALVGTADIAEATRLLSSARKTWIIGFRDSYPLALYAHVMLTRVLEQVAVLPRDGNSFAEDLIGLGANDAVLAIGFRRRPRILASLLHVATERQAGVILLTDIDSARVTTDGMVVFRCHARGSVFDSHAAGLSLLNLLCSQVVHARGEAGKQRLEAAETLHEQIKDLPNLTSGRARGL